jgi:transcriptional regulator with XRE-family HTH domain
MTGHEIKAARTRLKLRLVDLAQLAGMAVSTLSDIETGKIKRPGYDTIQALIKVIKALKPARGKRG